MYNVMMRGRIRKKLSHIWRHDPSRMLFMATISLIAIFLFVNYILFQTVRSRAAADLITLQMQSSGSGSSKILKIQAKASAAMNIRGYSFNVTFPSSSGTVSNIAYNFGTVSIGLGSDNNSLSKVNQSGQIHAQGESTQSSGTPLSTTYADIITVTYAGSPTFTINTAGKFYKIGTNSVLTTIPITLDNGSGNPTSTPTVTPTPSTGVNPTVTPTPTDSQNPTNTPTPTQGNGQPTNTPTPTGIQNPTDTPTPTPTGTTNSCSANTDCADDEACIANACTPVQCNITVPLCKQTQISNHVCSLINVSDGTSCGTNMTCQNGECISTNSTPTPTPPNPVTGNIILHLKVRFQGILKAPIDQYNFMTARVTLSGGPLNGGTKVQNIKMTADPQGVWSGDVAFDAPAGNGYKVLVKGPNHIQKRICDSNPTETYGGTYRCSDQGFITLNNGENSLDFSTIIQLVGDLPEQDGIIDSYDIAYLRTNLGSTDPNVLKVADLNLDGIVDTQDYALLIASLTVKYDEL